MNNVLFSKKMKMTDLIKINHNLILTLSRLGINIGFGEKSVEDVCAKSNVPVDFFLLICNVYSFDNYIPDTATIENTDMSCLVPYLLASHKYYMYERLPHIEHHLNSIVNNIEPKYGSILKNFFSDYKKEFQEHFETEETHIFPYLLQLRDGDKNAEYSIKEYVETHGGLDEKLSDLTQIVYKYLPGSALTEDSTELLFDILQLSSDLSKHTLIEDKILIPYIELLERRRK